MTPARVVRRRRSGLIAALAAVLFLGGLLGIEPRDDAWLLKLGARPLDLRGALSAAWQDALRDCKSVQRLDTGDPAAAAAVQALREFSPPDSRTASVLQIDRRGSPLAGRPAEQAEQAAQAEVWLAVQAGFDRLEPVVVLVRLTPTDAQVVPEGVWSGTTRPWNPAWRIRGFLAQRVPQAPPDLLDCLDPAPVFAQPPSPLLPG